MESAQEDLSEAELLQLAIDSRLIDLHTSFPARVEAYYPKSQSGDGIPTVDVTPQLNRSLPDGSDNFVSEPLPKLADVPVVFPRCGKYAITFPLVAGDYVLVVCCQRNIGAWRATGAQGDPGDLGTHTLDGAVAIAGLFPDSVPSPNADGTNMVVGREDNGNARLEFTPTGVNLGAGATKGVARNGDGCDGGTLLFVPGTSGASLSYFAPGVSPVGPGTPIQLSPKINQGSAHVKAVD